MNLDSTAKTLEKEVTEPVAGSVLCMKRLAAKPDEQFAESAKLEKQIRANLSMIEGEL